MKFSDLTLSTPYRELEAIFFTDTAVTPLLNPFIISSSNDAAKLLGVTEDLALDEKLVAIVNGEEKLAGSQSFSMCYAGHQFGYFVPRLGDGRAINLGKVNGQNLQLKGAGPTLYSRQGDGRAVLRSSIREYLMSEAMHGLGISTSRALALIGSDSNVTREGMEKAAIVLRLSPTWVRFGTFEYFNATGEHARLEELADYVIDESFPHLKGVEGAYLKMYESIMKNTAETIARWQSVGFNHGVMNTDNMSIDGRTIDYGPFAFLDDFDLSYVCNHTDTEGRYSFGNQANVAKWNLNSLAKALSAILNYDDSLKVLEGFSELFESFYVKIMFDKMGLTLSGKDDVELVGWLLGTLGSASIDYSLFFRTLSSYDGNRSRLLALVEVQEPLDDWLDSYDTRLKDETISTEKRHQKMLKTNPKYVLKNHILQESIDDAVKGDFRKVNDLLTVALDPFSQHPELEHLCKSAPKAAKNLKLSCSS